MQPEFDNVNTLWAWCVFGGLFILTAFLIVKAGTVSKKTVTSNKPNDIWFIAALVVAVITVGFGVIVPQVVTQTGERNSVRDGIAAWSESNYRLHLPESSIDELTNSYYSGIIHKKDNDVPLRVFGSTTLNLDEGTGRYHACSQKRPVPYHR